MFGEETDFVRCSFIYQVVLDFHEILHQFSLSSVKINLRRNVRWGLDLSHFSFTVVLSIVRNNNCVDERVKSKERVYSVSTLHESV